MPLSFLAWPYPKGCPSGRTRLASPSPVQTMNSQKHSSPFLLSLAGPPVKPKRHLPQPKPIPCPPSPPQQVLAPHCPEPFEPDQPKLSRRSSTRRLHQLMYPPSCAGSIQPKGSRASQRPLHAGSRSGVGDGGSHSARSQRGLGQGMTSF